ncbi:substrate-binding periplasmic protein [Psychrobacter sp. AOP1-A1-60]|uniref:substrate-binding periplasmic protein n=1 Tax=Psychrobacter sp. AOP1-A1-60 TaxID=3457727 RepID=UPI0040363709
MKKLFRVFPIVLSVGLFGCGNSNNAPTTQEAASEGNTKVTENKEEFVSNLPDDAPVVKVASDTDFAPYDFKDEYGNVTGFDIELMQQIGEDQGFKVVNYGDRWEEVFVNLDNKERDMVVAAVPYSPEHDSKYLLSEPYAPLPSTLLYLDDSKNITSLDDLKNLKIGVLDETVQYEYFSSDKVQVESVEPYITIFAAIQAMAQGEVDAVAEDAGALRYMMKDFADLSPKYFDYEDIHADSAYKVLVVDKDQPELLEKVNAGLESLKENGTYATLTTKWFGEDLTQAVSEQRKPKSTF